MRGVNLVLEGKCRAVLAVRTTVQIYNKRVFGRRRHVR